MEIVITCSHFNREANEVIDYRNAVEVSDSIVFDFRKFYDVLRQFYPRASFITFNVPTQNDKEEINPQRTKE